ncbi:MAG: MFS transporter [Acidobacteria bacterium]|nr:MFS transporter [Acidobacteriota bacterium]
MKAQEKSTEAVAYAPVVEEEPYPSSAYAWYVVGVLTFVYMFSFIDRQILNLLVRPIRQDLGIRDTEMSYLMGPAFAVSYILFGILFGRLADSKSRRTIIAMGFVAWSLFTAGCGVAKTYMQMFLLRVGVGTGEASLSPAAYSLITDYFPPKRRATAISVYGMGIYIGSGLAFIVGGAVTEMVIKQGAFDLPLVGATRPWQVVFFIIGLPGILFSLLLYTVREPLRRGARMIKTASGTTQVAQAPLREVIAYLRDNKLTFLCHNVGFALLSFSSYGTSAWVPTFFQRNHGWSIGKSGVVYGSIVMIFATLGIVAGGRFADWMAERGRRDATMRVGLIASLAWVPSGMLYPIVDNANLAAALLIPTAFLTSAPFGVSAAAIQQMMPNYMRGQASAIYLFVVNLLGLGIGPYAVAFFTDYVFRGDNSVRYSLLIVATAAHLTSALLLWIGLKPFRQSLDYLKEWTKAHA